MPRGTSTSRQLSLSLARLQIPTIQAGSPILATRAALLLLALLSLDACQRKTNAVSGTIELDEVHVGPRMAGRVEKIFAQEGLSGKASAEKLISYSLSLPVTACVVGMPQLDFIDTNIAIAKAYRPMPKEEMKELSDRLSLAHKAELDRFFCNHIDA